MYFCRRAMETFGEKMSKAELQQMFDEADDNGDGRIDYEGNTVKPRYLVLGYLEFCETRSVYLNQLYILIAFSNHYLAWDTFYKSKLPEVLINLHFG